MKTLRTGLTIALLLTPACQAPILQPITFGNLGLDRALEDRLRIEITPFLCILSSARTVLTSDSQAAVRKPGTRFSFPDASGPASVCSSWSHAPINLLMFESLTEGKHRFGRDLQPVKQGDICELDEASDSIDRWLKESPPNLPQDSVFVLALYYSENDDPVTEIHRIVFSARPHPNQNRAILVELLEAPL